MPSSRTPWALGTLAVVALLATSATGADPVGPAIGSKTKYTTSLKNVATTVDTDVYTGALIQGEAITVKVAAAKGVSLKPGIKLFPPGGGELTPEVKRNKKGNKATLKKFPIDVTGLWGVEIFGTEGGTGKYTVSFKVKKGKPLNFKNQPLPGPDTGGQERRPHPFGGIDDALMDLTVKFKKNQAAVVVEAIQDPSGDDVPSAPGKAADDVTPKGKTGLRLKKQPLSRGAGDYSITIASVGGPAQYNLGIKVTPQNRLTVKKAIELADDEPLLDALNAPMRGIVDDAFPARMTGLNFSQNPPTTVLFDGVPGTDVNVADGGRSLTVKPPPNVDGTLVDVAVVNPDGQASVRDDYFFYAPPPTITAVTDILGNPRPGGSTLGGETLRIRGTGLALPDMVFFGVNPVPTDQEISDTEIEVTSPAGGIGNVFVVVQDEFDRTSAPGQPWEYKVAPSFAPNPYLPPIAAVNTTPNVTVTGQGFDPTDTLVFDGVDIASVFGSGTTRTFDLPARPDGNYSVQIRDRLGTLVDGPDFFVKGPVTINSVEVIAGPEAAPNEIPLLGGSTVRVTGDRFHPSDTVSLGGVGAVVSNQSETSLDFAAPMGTAGLATLRITDGVGQVGSFADAVRYVGFQEDTANRSPLGNATDNLTAYRGAVGDLDRDSIQDDVVLLSYGYYLNNTYRGNRADPGPGTYNPPGTRAEYTRLLFGNAGGALVDVTTASIPAAGTHPSGFDNWNATCAAIGDLDKANGNDIVIGGYSPNWYYYNDVRLLSQGVAAGTFTYDATNSPASGYLSYVYAYYYYPGYDPTTNPYLYLVYGPLYVQGIPTCIAIGDLDNDTDMDVVVGRDNYDVTYLAMNPLYVDFTYYYYPVPLVYYYYVAYSNYYPNLYLNYRYYYSATTIFDNQINLGYGLVDTTYPQMPAIGNQNTTNPLPAFHARCVKLGDLTGDGRLDMVVTWDDPTTVTATDLRNGGGTAQVATRVLVNTLIGGTTTAFVDQTATLLPSGSSPEFWQGNNVCLVDVNGDTFLDIVLVHKAGVTGGHTRHSLRVLLSNRPSSNSFRDATTTVLPALPTDSNDDFRGDALEVRDVNGDGIVDILVGTSEKLRDNAGNRIRSTRLFMGRAGGTFTLANEFLPAVTADSGEVHDLRLGDLSGSPDPSLFRFAESTPDNAPNGTEAFRVSPWVK